MAIFRYMNLSELCVVHLKKRGRTPEQLKEIEAAAGIRGAFCFDSCQRKLWVATLSMIDRQTLVSSEVEIYSADSAYLFLLQVACGLESAVVGETDVFGQFKQAWKAFEDSGLPLRKELGPWIQKIFEDTKEIRSRYLENLGGASYGTLVRRMLSAKPGERVFFVGAGAIARSVAPYFTDSEIWVWNRTAATAEALASELREKGARNVRVLFGSEGEAEGWCEAEHVVVCIPVDDRQGGDSRRVALRQASGKPGLVAHLGCLHGQGAENWDKLESFRSLDSLFDLKASQAEVRDQQIAAAHKACRERSMLRAMGGSITIPHGWEDLAVFS